MTMELHEAAERRTFQALLAAGCEVLGEAQAREALAGLVPFGAAIACESDDDVTAAAARLGWPVVVKALSPEVVHKSEHALVRVGCGDESAAVAAAAELRAAVAAAAPGAPFLLSVQRQLAGAELAIGLRRDPLGAVVVVSAGGTLIELLRDTATELAPVDEDGARVMLRALRVWPLLEGYRGGAGVDVDALARLVAAVSRLAVAVPEIAELDLNPVFAAPDGCAVADARVALAVPEEEEEPPAPAGEAMRALLAPRRIAVVGASDDETKVGGLVLRYLRRHAWPGEVVAINRRPLATARIPTYERVQDVPGGVDLAAIAVPAGAVEAVVEDCVAAGVPAGVIFTAGFAETGEEGRALQERIVAAARAGGFRLVGPNTIGLASPADGMVAAFGMALERPSPAGPVGFVSQSGAIASSLVSRAEELGVGFSHWISAGNEADLGLADFVEALAEDPRTSTICLFVEAIRRPRAFAAACARARAAGKPLLALKAGRSEAGRAAAVSHTGAMTGADAVYRAFLRRHGVVQVDDLPGLLAAAQGLASVGPVAGRRIAIVSMSGGACSLLADACEDAGLDVPELSLATQARLREALPPFGGVRNPIDVTASGIRTPDLVRRTVALLRESGEVDLILLQLSTNADPAAARMASDLVALRAQPGTPFLLGRLGSPALAPQAMRVYGKAGLHVFSWPGQLVAAARACVQSGALRPDPEA